MPLGYVPPRDFACKTSGFVIFRGGGGGSRTRVLEQGLDRFYKFVRTDIVGIRVVVQLTPYP